MNTKALIIFAVAFILYSFTRRNSKKEIVEGEVKKLPISSDTKKYWIEKIASTTPGELNDLYAWFALKKSGKKIPDDLTARINAIARKYDILF